jgi:starch phosphorylase
MARRTPTERLKKQHASDSSPTNSDDTTMPVQDEPLDQATIRHLRCSLGRQRADVRPRDLCRALAFALRDRAAERMLRTELRQAEAGGKRLYFLSTEYLFGRSLAHNLLNLSAWDEAAAVARDCGLSLNDVLESDEDVALGNDGLGRLAACFLDSLATLGLPAVAYGLNYEYGLFRQEIDNGYQREQPAQWRRENSPWMIERGDASCLVPVYGRVEHGTTRDGGYNPMWLDWHVLVGMPHDLPIIGLGGQTTNRLRLFSVRASDEFDIGIFSQGDYLRAVEQKIRSEVISKLLYPTDDDESGKELRLLQEYFFVYCALNDIVRQYLRGQTSFDAFADCVAIHLNDTRPALAILELMRILVDEHEVDWESAWKTTQATFSYTNHALLPEGLIQWPVGLLQTIIPRHLQIAYEINRRFLERVAELYPDEAALQRHVSFVQEGHEKRLRLSHLAVTGSHSVSGVARPQAQQLKERVLPQLSRIYPERFNTKTNGVSHRRWLLQANPALASLISSTIGDGWVRDAGQLGRLEPSRTDEAFCERFRRIKRENKERLARRIAESAWITVDPDSLFDVQVKRISEYKRQLLNLMHIVHLYLGVTEDGRELVTPRTFVFAGKAAPGYWAAKQIIKCINNVAQVINRDRRTRGQLHVAFLPDYRVSLAEQIIVAADLSEQISTAGTEACGTGSMKLVLNGALTIGTRDGANSEIIEQVGEDNFFSFGLTVDQVAEKRRHLTYDPREAYEQDQRIRRVIDALASERFTCGEPGIFGWIHHTLVDGGDNYFHLADFESYLQAHERVEQQFTEGSTWTRKSILNVARCGSFSSDRTVREYADQCWQIKPVGID